MTIREKITADFSIPYSWIERLIKRSPHTYKIYEIPKRTGGMRTIAQPSKETKLLQSWVIENYLAEQPIHNCATAYKKGASIKKNAWEHRESNYIAKFDFKNFFTSITSSDIERYINSLSFDLSEQDVEDIISISCIDWRHDHNLTLSVGAPISPILSNQLMFRFDEKLSEWCENRNVIYTRYADDLTLSSHQREGLDGIELKIREVIQTLDYPHNLEINTTKTTFVSKRYQRKITGVVINNEGALSIGRKKKREIRAMVHHYVLKKLPLDKCLKLQGLLAFVFDIEPEYIARLKIKYGDQVINSIFQIRK